MDDKRTPMEAEVLELPPQTEPSCPDDFYGTAARPLPRRSHAWVWVCAGLAVIAVCTFSVVAALLHVRLENGDGGWRLSMQSSEETETPQDGVRDLDVSGEADYVPRRGPGGSIQISTEESGGDNLAPAAVYAQVSPAVVCVEAESYYGSESCSGVVLSADGYVLTASLGLSGYSSITVSFSDGGALSAKRIGEDRVTGLCLLKVEAEGLRTVTFAADDSASVGQGVYCVCSPYGSQLPNVFCTGMLALSRSVELGGREYGLLQAAVQPQGVGYGCPILDGRGRLLGLTTPIGKRLVSGEDPCFAVCAGDLQRIVAELGSTAAGESAWLGLEVSEIPEDYRLLCGFPGSLWIDEVEPGSPADGVLLQYDVITAVDGEEVATAADFERLISSRAVGDWVWLMIYRSGNWYRIHLPVLAR